MRILLVHNYYGSSAPSGENRVFEAERAMLEKYGEIVETFTRHSDEIRGAKVKEEGEGGQWTCRFLSRAQKLYGLIKGAVCTVANPFAAWALKKKIREFGPDVVHFHNTFPLISPLAIRAAHKSGAKVVMTLHNYRTVCAAGVPTRCGKVCTECFVQSNNQNNQTILPAICHRCYRGSLLATIPLALDIWLYRKRWAKWVDRFICLTPFARDMMISAGFPADKLVVKGNFIQAVGVQIESAERENQVLYVGRLSEEKGVKTLIEAWNLMGENAPVLKIIGDGDSRGVYEGFAKNPRVQFCGQQPHNEVLRAVATAKLVVIPSMCYEGLPTNLMEAFVLGTPCLVSDLGALPSLVGDDRMVFKAGDANALARTVAAFMQRDDWRAVSLRVREMGLARYSEDQNYKMINSIYREVTE